MAYRTLAKKAAVSALTLMLSAIPALAPEPTVATETPTEQETTNVSYQESLESTFPAVEASINGSVGVVVTNLSAGATKTFGPLQDDVAWSTAKVPIAIAALRAGTANPTDVTAAITVSDNDAAARLWNSLGGGQASAAAVDTVLREAGDHNTTFQHTTNAFGLTPWTLEDQVQFMAGLEHMHDSAAEHVKHEMGAIAEEHRWGLGQKPDGYFKGGWGPDETGMYLDRQAGVITIAGEKYAVAIASRNHDGTHESSLADLSTLSNWLREYL